MADGNVAIAAITLAGSIAAGFFTLVNKQNKTHEKIAKAVENLASQSGKVVTSNEEIAKATNRSADEAKERNGHIAELIVGQGEMIQEVAKNTTEAIIKGVSEIDEQKVHNQTVEHSTVNEREGK